jgi:hypothetical protein
MPSARLGRRLRSRREDARIEIARAEAEERPVARGDRGSLAGEERDLR